MKRFIHTSTILSLVCCISSCSPSPEEIESHFENENYEQALSAINRRKFFNVGELKMLHIQARCQEELGETDDAIETYEEIINYDPNYAYAHAGIGKILFEKEEYDKAENHLLKAASLFPDDFEILFLTGRTQLMVKNWERAEVFLSQVQKMNPEFAPVYYYVGMARANRGDVYGAAASFNTYIQKEPDNLVARYNRGFALLKIGYLPWALEDFDFVLKNNPDHYEALGKKGICLAKMGNPEGCQLIHEAANKGSDYAKNQIEKFCL